ncbi:MAG: 50S ribosomal protein L11 methyltransferase [Patescibacteria group bacterium]|nr:50S ribosomal protein L11 methyltransferase [Patescibacteria group bacterium]
MVFLLVNGVLFLSVLLLLLLISMVWPPDSPWAPFWTTKPEIARAMCKVANVNEDTVIYDLGCGTGNTICIAAKEFGAPAVGIEIDPLRFINAWFNVTFRFKVQDRVTLVRDNFFHIPFNKADVFFIYLIPNALKRLTPKFLKEVKPGALLVSYVYPFPVELFNGRLRLITHDTKHKIYMYKMGK